MKAIERINEWRYSAPLWQAAIVGGVIWGTLVGLFWFAITKNPMTLAFSLAGGLLYALAMFLWMRARRRADTKRSNDI